MEQLDIFDYLYNEYKITKPIRLIELFAGVGSQAMALKLLGVDFEHYKICEWAIPSIIAYDLVHTNDGKDYSSHMSVEELKDYLYKRGISNNYNDPMTEAQVKRLPEEQARKIYNAIYRTNNLVNIMETKGGDLEIVETDKYEYIMTYSFPCQDLSLAGKQAGMGRDSGTRSGMLWEVERLLKETEELPQILLMENVPQVIGTNNISDFQKWQYFLEKLGYVNYVDNLNSKDYGMPQNRNRTFMVSILGNYNYNFPKTIPLKLKLKDLLEKEVDEKYYLSDKAIKGMLNTTYQSGKYENRVLGDIASTLCSRDYKDPKCVEVFDFRYDEGIRERVDSDCSPTLTTKVGTGGISGQSLLKIPEATKKGYCEAYEGDGVYINRPHQKRGVVQEQMIQTIKTSVDDLGVVVKPEKNLKEHLADTLIEKGLVKENDVIKHSYSSSRLENTKRPTVEMNNISPTLDTKCDCLGVVVKEPLLRIRKLTPKECWRLMGFSDSDFNKASKELSNSKLYHIAGDSIVSWVLVAIFGKLLGVDYRKELRKLERNYLLEKEVI